MVMQQHVSARLSTLQLQYLGPAGIVHHANNKKLAPTPFCCKDSSDDSSDCNNTDVFIPAGG
jgi:hypothetical protein